MTGGITRIASWNVNSIRARFERLKAWLVKATPDVVCLQELKVSDDEFPRLELEGLGWHVAVHGQKTYNGVAIMSRTALDDVRLGLGDGTADSETRLIAARTAGFRILSAYVPNGQVVGSEKWAYKLEWMRRLTAHLAATYSPAEPLLLMGDFNVAPEDRDIARPDEWRHTVLAHEDGRARLREIVAWGFTDTIRMHHTGDGPYTWWDYRMLGFPKGNGLRIDHILATASAAQRCVAAFVDREERKGKLPSDHAPVIAEFRE